MIKMRYTNTTEKNIYDFIEKNKELINDIYLMGVTEPYAFNEMEGYHADIKLKIETVDGYRNKFVKFTINSSYLNGDDTFEDYARNCLITAGDCLL